MSNPFYIFFMFLFKSLGKLLAAITKTVGADIIPYDDIAIGSMYDITRDDDGNIIEMRKTDKGTASPVVGQQAKV